MRLLRALFWSNRSLISLGFLCDSWSESQPSRARLMVINSIKTETNAGSLVFVSSSRVSHGTRLCTPQHQPSGKRKQSTACRKIKTTEART
ncbi:hypothetical protein BDV11DRAFT_181378 [Aspergillus similis]